MKIATMTMAAIMMTAILAPTTAWEQTKTVAIRLATPEPVKLTQMTQQDAATWQRLAKFAPRLAKDYDLVPQPADDNGQARRDFAIVSDGGKPRGHASISLMQSPTDAATLAAFWRETILDDINLDTTPFSIAGRTANDASCLTTVDRTNHANEIDCSIAHGPKLFELDISLPPGPMQAATVAEAKQATETAAALADMLTTTPHVAAPVGRPDPAVVAALARSPAGLEDANFEAAPLGSLDATTLAAFNRTKAQTFEFALQYGVAGPVLSQSRTYAEYTRALSGPGASPESTVTYRIYANDIPAMMFASRSGRGLDPAWLPSHRGTVRTYSTTRGDTSHEGDVTCLDAPLPTLGKEVTRCFTNKDNDAVAVTFVTNLDGLDEATTSVQAAGRIATSAAKAFNAVMNDATTPTAGK